MNIIGTGLSGLVGSRVVDLLTPRGFSFLNLSLEQGIDITRPGVIEDIVRGSDAKWVFHFAAKTDVDRCETDRELGRKSDAWSMNVETTRRVAEACRKAGKHVLYISTDYVFDGRQHRYTETSRPHPLGWYARTKYEGERHISKLGSFGLIIRIANPYRANPTGKKDFVHKIAELLRDGETVLAPDDQQMTVTFIDDIAEAISKLVDIPASGIYHVVGTGAVTPFSVATTIADVLGFDSGKIVRTDFRAYFAGRAPRPFRAVLSNDRIAGLGVHMRSFAEGMREVQKQEERS